MISVAGAWYPLDRSYGKGGIGVALGEILSVMFGKSD
jgi:hypothetical protein